MEFNLPSSKISNEYLLLQAPNNGYYWIVEDKSQRFYYFVNSGYHRILSGQYDYVVYMKEKFEELGRSIELLEFKCKKNFSTIQTTIDCLKQILIIDPEFLNDKELVKY